jgi:light-regulated signal transduction histidine kinase (bacteriophytochrome)
MVARLPAVSAEGEVTDVRRAGDELTLAGLLAVGPGNACDAEPIHLSGAIQPHGFLLGADPATSIVRVASLNLVDHIGVAAADAVGSTLAEVLGAAADRVPPLTTVRADLQPDPLPIDLARDRRYEVATHLSGSLVLLEFERSPNIEQGFPAFHEALRIALDPVLAASDIATVCSASADQIRALTGFDRVVVYQFADDAHGVVVAESVDPDAMEESLLGLHYPAGDIPRQARALFLRKRVRVIADADYEPVPLVGQAVISEVDALDLTMSDLRSVSPMHLQYLHDMDVAATMSISIVHAERLWGMVLCHHKTPKQIPHGVRAVCETLTRTLSLQLDVERSRVGRERAALQSQLVTEIVGLLGRPDTLEEIVGVAALSLTGLVGADGVVVRLDGEIANLGDLVDPDDLEDFVAGVAELAAAAAARRDPTSGTAEPIRPLGAALPGAAAPAGDLWSTDQLDEALPELASGRPVPVAGVLVLPLSEEGDDLIIWVRRERIDVVTWAGAIPDDGPTATGPGEQPETLEQAHRTRDFSPRKQDVRGRSRSWQRSDLAAAHALGEALPEALLRRARRLLAERDAGSRAERAASTATRERLERELQRKLRLESLGKLAGGVAHDFNNLLSVILSHAEFVEDALGVAAREPGGERWAEVTSDTRQITLATQRAALLTRQLLTFARREVSQPRPLDLNVVILDLEVLLRRTLGPHIDLQLFLTAEPTTVLADPEQVERVLVNLAVNARDAMPNGGLLTITTDTTTVAEGDQQTLLATGGNSAGDSWAGGGAVIPAATGEASGPGTGMGATGTGVTGLGTAGPEKSPPLVGRHVRLRVGDTGSGIPKDVLDRVFDPFFTTKGEGEGSGLGLATVHGIVNQAGGRIAIYSERGIGTSVTVLLPATDAIIESSVVEPVVIAHDDRTILVVEDEPAIREVTRRILESTGYQVLMAETGPEAVATAETFPGTIDLLLTDVVMPGMLGREVAARVRAARPNVGVVFMSGFAAATASEAGTLEFGALLLDKPFTRNQLLTKLAEIA